MPYLVKLALPEHEQFDLAFLLREIARYDYGAILAPKWRIAYMDIHAYGDTGGAQEYAFKAVFPEISQEEGENYVEVSGRRLLEGSALIHYTEECLLLRYQNPGLPIEERYPYPTLSRRQPLFLYSNVDMQIAAYEGIWDIVTPEKGMADWLCSRFPGSELVEG